jgi:hypothetical protein
MSVENVRGYRNNNPGNIEKGAPWQGLAKANEMTAVQRKERRFAVFSHPKWGIRAIARILITYQDKRNSKDGSSIDTVQEIIERWAPEHENDTKAYVRHVRQAMGLEKGQKVDVHRYEHMRPLVEAIIHHELGVQPYDGDLIDEGIKLAGVNPPAPALGDSPAVKGTQVGGVAVGGLGMAAALIEALGPTLPLLKTLAEHVPWAIAGIFVLILLWVVWREARSNEVAS